MAAASTRPRLVHVGNAVVDVVLTVPHLPVRGGDVLASGQRVEVGGGFNVMAAAARQGLRVLYGGMHGTGPLGDRTRSALRAEGVTVLQPVLAGVDTGTVTVLVEPDGERTFVTSPGAEARLDAQALARVVVAPSDLVHVSGYGLAHPVNREALIAWVPSLPQGATVLLDPGPLAATLAASALGAVLERADWVSATAEEATALTGETDPWTAAAALSGRAGHGRRGGAVVRLGAEGCLVVTAGAAPRLVPGVPVAAVDLNGAGDTHTGVLVAALADGLHPAEAAWRANAAAAWSVTRRGPATAPVRQELDAFLAALPGAPGPPTA